jgi:hypothetical protein
LLLKMEGGVEGGVLYFVFSPCSQCVPMGFPQVLKLSPTRYSQ